MTADGCVSVLVFVVAASGAGAEDEDEEDEAPDDDFTIEPAQAAVNCFSKRFFTDETKLGRGSSSLLISFEYVHLTT